MVVDSILEISIIRSDDLAVLRSAERVILRGVIFGSQVTIHSSKTASDGFEEQTSVESSEPEEETNTVDYGDNDREEEEHVNLEDNTFTEQ